MKWIGQHIWDFISRFRSDVYLEAVESGTIASGGNLGLDSNNKVVKAAEVGSSVDLTSEVTGILPVANGGSGASSLTDNSVLTGTGTSPITAEANFTYSGSALSVNAVTSTFTNATSSQVIIKNTGNNTAGGILDLINERSTGVDSDYTGNIRFYGNDASGNATLTTQMLGQISETNDGDEFGLFKIETLSGGQQLRNAFQLSSTAGDDEVDIGLGYGAASTTTIAGDITITSGLTIGGHEFDDIDIGSEFTDTDDHIMSSGAIKEKIESYGYTTSTGDITGVTITTDSGGGSAASDTAGSADFSILGANGVGVTNSGTTRTAAAVPG